MKPDGWVVIGTKVDDTGFEKDMKKLESKKVKTEVEIDPDLQGYDVLSQVAQQKAQEVSEEAQITPNVDLQEVDNQLSEAYLKTSELLNRLKEVSMTPSEDTGPMLELIAELDSVGTTIEELDAKRAKLTNHTSEDISKIKEGISDIKKSSKDINSGISNLNKGLTNVVSKVGRWGLALFGVSGAYGAIRRAISIVSAQNERVANSFQQIQKVIAGALLPVVQTVINWIVKLMVYINYIWKAFTGKALFNFADATKKSASELKKGAGSSGKIADNLKEAKKQLMGFDEMNVLQDQTDTSAGSGGGGGVGDTDFGNIFDKFKNVPIPDWVKWIAEHGDLVRKILEGIAAALWAIKTNAGLIKGLGMFFVIDGILNLIKDLKKYLDDPTWDNFSKVLADISEILVGFGMVVGLATPLGVILAIIGQIGFYIAGLPQHIKNIIAFIKDPSWENFLTTVRSALDVLGIVGRVVGWILDQTGLLTSATKKLEVTERDLTKVKKQLTSAQRDYTNAVDLAEDAAKRLKEAEKNAGITGEELYKKVQDGTLNYKDMNKQQREVYKAYLDNELAQKNLADAQAEVNKLIEKQKILKDADKIATSNNTSEMNKYKKAVVDAYNKGAISADDARKAINTATKNMSSDNRKTFTQDLPNDIKNGLDTGKYEGKWNTFKSNWKNKFISKLAHTITLTAVLGPTGGIISQISQLGATLGQKLASKMKINMGGRAKGGIYYPSKVPKLAVGGIINQPGSGIPYHGAVIGERGAEAVVPLTDSQQMALLGEAIGRYITVNANITNTMNGRIISRELKKIQNEDDFAFNR